MIENGNEKDCFGSNVIRNGIKHGANGIVLCITVHKAELYRNPLYTKLVAAVTVLYRILGTPVCVLQVQKQKHVSFSCTVQHK